MRPRRGSPSLRQSGPSSARDEAILELEDKAARLTDKVFELERKLRQAQRDSETIAEMRARVMDTEEEVQILAAKVETMRARGNSEADYRARLYELERRVHHLFAREEQEPLRAA